MGNSVKRNVKDNLIFDKAIKDLCYDYNMINIYRFNNQLFCQISYQYFNWEEYQKGLELFEKGLLNQDKNVISIQKISTKQNDNFCSNIYNIDVYYEYCQYKLIDEINYRKTHEKRYQQNEILFIIKSIFNALKFLQKQNKFHGYIDLKNILIDNNKYYKIVDNNQFSYNKKNINYDYFCLGIVILECILLKRIDSYDSLVDKYQFNINSHEILQQNIQFIDDNLYQFIQSLLFINKNTIVDFLQIENQIKIIEQQVNLYQSINNRRVSQITQKDDQDGNEQILAITFVQPNFEFQSCIQQQSEFMSFTD